MDSPNNKTKIFPKVKSKSIDVLKVEPKLIDIFGSKLKHVNVYKENPKPKNVAGVSLSEYPSLR